MPVALIVFADKSHADLHGALSLMPIIFTLTLFNRAARCNSRFWRPFGHLPNYGYGKGTADKQSQELKSKMSIIVFHLPSSTY